MTRVRGDVEVFIARPFFFARRARFIKFAEQLKTRGSSTESLWALVDDGNEEAKAVGDV